MLRKVQITRLNEKYKNLFLVNGKEISFHISTEINNLFRVIVLKLENII